RSSDLDPGTPVRLGEALHGLQRKSLQRMSALQSSIDPNADRFPAKSAPPGQKAERGGDRRKAGSGT
ncbi:MAG: hypothetical protein RBS21_06045, partial [Corynebacterium sp.]|nr:hypothetical protein [Corynebacterium sp.]